MHSAALGNLGSKRSPDDFSWKRRTLSSARLFSPSMCGVSGLPSLATVSTWSDISTLHNPRHFNLVATKVHHSKAKMSLICNSGMSLSPATTTGREIGHGMGGAERAAVAQKLTLARRWQMAAVRTKRQFAAFAPMAAFLSLRKSLQL